MRRTLFAAAALALLLAAGVVSAQAPPPMPLRKSGRFGLGLGIELLGLGPCETVTRFGSGGGVSLLTAVQQDLGARWALRFPLSVDSTIHGGNTAYVVLALSPGVVYRWRRSPTLDGENLHLLREMVSVRATL